MGQLDGKVALITGASKGIGRVMSQLFAQEGASVICAARSRDLVEETAGLVKAAGGRALAVIGDAAAEGDVKNMVERGVKAFGRLDVLVNNAGDGGPTKRVQDYTTEDWFYTINSCLTSSYLCTRFAVPEMIKAGGGAIVNITSTAGRRGLPFRIGYCSAKAGQVGMTYGMALELAPHNIRVNAIAPGRWRATASTASSPGRPRCGAWRSTRCGGRSSTAPRSSACRPPTTSRRSRSTCAARRPGTFPGSASR
jgi:NAD(P)-dependent dehydrogenase (short-subunit alcohol dehydrogenase family)